MEEENYTKQLPFPIGKLLGSQTGGFDLDLIALRVRESVAVCWVFV